MRVVGVIAEYNPFHLGHAHHIAEAKRQSHADAAVVVMSSCFTQRGEAALFSPATRAEMALRCGADAVFALPTMWSTRDAEHFALGGVALLARLGCNAISFGTEVQNLPLLWDLAHLFEAEDAYIQQSLRIKMQRGFPYPAALAEAVEEQRPGAYEILHNPNSTLALCYLRAMIRLRAKMDVIPVQRTGDYHAAALDAAMPSATAVRSAVLRGDWASAKKAVPAEVFALLREAAAAGQIHRPDALDNALLYRLRTMDAEEYAALPDISEGIEYRLREAAQRASTREELLHSAKTRRYPYARLSRLATHALLGLTGQTLSHDTPNSAWLLGFREEARGVFGHIRTHGTLPILSKAADMDRHCAWLRLEERAYDLWALGASLPAGLAMTQGVVRI